MPLNVALVHARFNMKQRVGIDLDSVIGATEVTIKKFLEEEHGLYIDWDNEFMCYDFDKNPYLSVPICDDLKKAIESGELVMDIPVYNFAEHGIGKLVRENFEIIIITGRPSHLEDVTIKWLAKNNIHYNKLILTNGSKNKIDIIYEEKVKAFIDDRFEVLNYFLKRYDKLDYGMFIVTHPWNKRYFHKDIVRVNSMHEACDQIVENRNNAAYTKHII